MPYKKLIETAMPVSVINAEAEREKKARTGMPSAIHLWWSRRPMAAARSVLFASLVDDPSEHPERFPTQQDQERERARLVQMTGALSTVEGASDEALLAEARKEILQCTEDRLPRVFDPFAGSGTIPIEAHRLGLSTWAADLNPVAAMITTVGTDIPSRFHDRPPVHPESDPSLGLPLPGAQGFAQDVRYYGEWALQEAEKRIGSLYPTVRRPDDGAELKTAAWIWARTVQCPNPACGCSIPLSSSYDLARKKGSEAWVEPVVEDGRVTFLLHREPKPSDRAKPKVAQTAVFKCPACGEITPDAYVKACGTNHRITSQMIAIVADDGQKRLYLPPTPEQMEAAKVAKPTGVPRGMLPDFPRRFSPPLFGLTEYADLFTNRQLVFITTMLSLAREAQADAEKRAIEMGYPDDGEAFATGGHGALAYAQAIRIALTMTISKLLDRCSSMCSWDASGGGSLRNVFSRAAMPMVWDYAEGNPFGESSGSFKSALGRTCEAVASLPTEGDSRTVVADAKVPNALHGAMLCTELPYYDKASYADLSDFFYVWLRAGIGDLFPDCFQPEITAKESELTAFPYRWGGDRQLANVTYEQALSLALKELYKSTADDVPSTIAFQYRAATDQNASRLSEWEAFVTAVCNAGFTITASWPLARRYDQGIETVEGKEIPITVVIRRRPEDAAVTTRRAFVSAVKRELPTIASRLWQQIGMIDLRASVIGPALNLYSRYSKVMDADGTTMPPQTAIRIIEQELDTIMASLCETVGTKEEESDV